MRISMCGRHEIGEVMGFIDRFWSPGHILSSHQSLMDFQHFDRVHDRYTYVTARSGGELAGVLGFIPTRLYDPGLTDSSTCWLALWKVREDAGAAGLGLRMLSFLEREEPHTALAVLGIGSDDLLAMYDALGFATGECTHWFVTRRGAGLSVAELPPGAARPYPAAGSAVLRETAAGGIEHDAEALVVGSRAARAPVKSPAYFRRRYLEHPVYRYRVHVVEAGGVPRGLLATRVAAARGGSVLRIVDYYGDPEALELIGDAVGALLAETGSEYADVWSAGVPSEHWTAAGFAPVDPAGPAIVPNNFEPFEPVNRVIRYAYKASEPMVMFRADGDQDRPSLRPPAR